MKRETKKDALEIGKRVANLRKSNNMTQNELAHLLLVGGRSTVNSWEKGASKPKSQTIIKLADLFNVTSDYILKGVEPDFDFIDSIKRTSSFDIDTLKREIEKDPSFFGIIRGIVGTSEQERLFFPLFRSFSDVSSVFDGKTPLEKIEVLKHIENKENSNMFAVVVEDDKMSDVLPLDYIAIFEKGDFETGDIVFANCNGSNVIRRITRTKFAFLLEDEKGETIFIDCTGGNCDAVRIYGKLVFAYKEF